MLADDLGAALGYTTPKPVTSAKPQPAQAAPDLGQLLGYGEESQPIAAPPVAQPAPPPPGLIHPDAANAMATDTANKIVGTGQTISADPQSFLQRLAAPFVGPGSMYGAVNDQRTGGRVEGDPYARPLIDAHANDKYVTGGPISRGITQGGQDAISGFTTLKSIGLLLATGGLGAGEAGLAKEAEASSPKIAAAGARYFPRIKALVSGGFGLDMIWSAAKESPVFLAQLRSGDIEGATRTLTGMAISGGMAAMSGHHAVTELRSVPPVEAPPPAEPAFTSTGQPLSTTPAPPAGPAVPAQPLSTAAKTPRVRKPKAAQPAQPAAAPVAAPIAFVPDFSTKKGQRAAVKAFLKAHKPGDGAAPSIDTAMTELYETPTKKLTPRPTETETPTRKLNRAPAKPTIEEAAAAAGLTIEQPKHFHVVDGKVVKIEKPAKPPKAAQSTAAPVAPAPIETDMGALYGPERPAETPAQAPFSVQMREAKTADEGRSVLHRFDEHFGSIEKDAGVTPSVGQITPTYSRGSSTLKPKDWKLAVAKAKARSPYLAKRLQAMVDDYPAMREAWEKLYAKKRVQQDKDFEDSKIPKKPSDKIKPAELKASTEAARTRVLRWMQPLDNKNAWGQLTPEAVEARYPGKELADLQAAGFIGIFPGKTPHYGVTALGADWLKTRPEPVKGVKSKGATTGSHTVTAPNPEPLGAVPAGDGKGTPGAGPTGNGPEIHGQADKPGVRDLHPGGAISGSGGGTDAGNVDEPEPTVTRPPRRIPRSADTRPRLTGYRITAADHLGEGTPQEKALANIEAIRTMKLVESEARPATLDEQRKLVKYTGWGALANIFENYQANAWERTLRTELKDLLTPDEWKTAAATTPNAHYTSETVIRAIWSAAERLGIKAGASILEPAMGSGNFFGLIPDALIPGTKLAGVELDPVTARIAALLYPNAGTYASGFEKTRFPDNWFDLAISNVPFGNYGVHDAAFKGERRNLTSSIHNYFFAKALDKVRPGGIVAFITSRYTMDTASPAVREYLATHAKLLGAIRLPQTAFEKNAGTTVVTDVIFLQKRAPGDASPGESFTQAPQTSLFPGDKDNPHQNEYYSKHPQNILGTVKGNRGRFGPEINVLGQITPELLDTAIKRLPENVVTDRKVSEAFNPNAIAIAEYPEAGSLKQNAFGIHQGKIVRRNGEMLEPQTLPKETAQRVTGMIGIRDAMHNVFRTQLTDRPDTEITAARKELGKVYDKFVARYGALNDRVNVAAFKGDPDAQPILALEKLDARLKTVAKTDIFTQATLQTYRPVGSVETAKEAMTVSLNEYGRINWPRMAQLTGLDQAEMQEELGDLIFRDPATAQWQPGDEYLSGDIRQKLAQAKDLAKTDPEYQRNVTALEAAKPPDLEPGEIVARLGAPWIPTSVVSGFVRELLGLQPGDVSVAYSPAIATWRLVLSRGQAGAKNTSEWAGGDIPANELIEMAMNMKVATVKVLVSSDPDKYAVDPKRTAAAQDMQDRIKKRFKEWVWESPTRGDALAKIYNDTYNGIRLREYDGSHLTLQGANPAIELRAHQKNAIWRIVSSGRNVLLAHVVGAGKTFEMIGGAMELRRLGLAKKPMLTVPANIVGQFGEDFRKLYPAANILVADKDTFSAENRQKAMGHVATGNWDAVIISHDAFGLLPVADETFNAFLQKEIDQLEDAIRESKAGKADAKIQKELEKSKKRLEAKLRKKADREGKDNSLTFEQLGIDALFVDEADLFKNLYFTTRATRIAGIPNSESNRAFDMLIKSRHVTDKTGGRLIFATGTPIANTVAEMYTMQRYLAHKELEAAGLGQFDAWAQQFGESVTGLETSPDGAGLRVNTRFASFDNLPELQKMFRSFADVQTADMLKLPIPKLFGGKYETISIPATQVLKEWIMGKDEEGNFLPGTLMARIAAIKGGRVKPEEDNMLKVTSEGRKAALDLRLIGRNVDPVDSKVNVAVKRIFEIWEEGKEKRTTQMVFSDLSVPNKDGRWNVYDEIKRKLIIMGVPAEEIAFAHDAKPAQKLALVAKMNAGEIRILIGSTGKMGAGVNAQARLIALHHLDVPWRPRDVEQRQGRILRQGNMNPEVHIIRYVTSPSFDSYMWGLVTRKGKFINQVLTGNLGLRSAEDIGGDSLGAAEAEAAASGNPLIMEKAKIDNEAMRLSALESEHARKQISARMEQNRALGNIERATIWIPRLEADIATRDAKTPKDFTITVGKKVYTERKAAGEALNKFAIDRRMDEEVTTAGSYRGFELRVQGSGAERPSQYIDGEKYDANPPKLMYFGEATHYARLNTESGPGTIQSLDAELKGMDRQLEQAQDEVRTAKANAKQYEVTANTPFAEGALLDKLLARQRELIQLLDLGNSAPVDAQDTSTGGAGKAEETEDEDEKNPRSGAVSLDFLTLGIPQFVKADVAPVLRDAATGIRDTADDILKVLAPTLRSPEASTASLILRGKLAELARKSDQAKAALETASKYFRSRPAAENYDFIDRMETGQRQTNADLDHIAFVLRKLLDDKRADVQSLGTGKLKTFYKDYFPHIWKKPQRAATVFASFFGKRPLEGGKSFLRKRKLPTIADGRAVGLEPVTDNPVELVLLKVREMDRYVMAHETLADWKTDNLAKFVRGIKPPPRGWARINDSISTVYGQAPGGELVIRGHYYAPEGAARILNNYLSPGLREFGAYRVILGLNNVLNQFQLGLSAFHLGFTAADTTVSKMALGYQALLTGHPIKAGKLFAATPTASFTSFLKGDKMLREWYKPGSQGAAIGSLVDNLVTAGGRARMDQMYRTQIAEKMMEALRHGNVIGAALRLPFAGVEWTSNLIMDQVVPRMKLGAFADMARFHMEELGPNATFEETRLALTRDWNSIENRLGELTYDNLFWDKITKDLLMISTRSVGWNLGTLREIGGGIADVVAQPVNKLRGRPVNLNRLAYLMALVTVNATMSAIYQYLKTGKGPAQLEDYFFPQNGETDEHGHPQRVSWPTYIKDVYHYGTHPVKTLEGKVAPIWSAFAEMIHNRDFYGVEIRHPDDPLVQQLEEEAKHVAGLFTPIGVRNYQRETKLGASIGTRAEQFVGVTPAPAELNQSPAERMAHEFTLAHTPDEARTAGSAERRDLREAMTRALRMGKPIPAGVLKARAAGKLSKRDLQDAVRGSRENTLQRAFLSLSIGDALKVYRVATAAEKKQLQGDLVKKTRNALATEPADQRAKTLADVKAAISGSSR